MTIIIPVSPTITINLGPKDPENPGSFAGGTISGLLNSAIDNKELNSALEAIESILLAHACAGVDVTSPSYVLGIETALDAIFNFLG